MLTSIKSDTKTRFAAGYLRRSSDKQQASIPEQKAAIERYARKHGYKIVRWYIDDAISGDATEKRLDFQRMIREATESTPDGAGGRRNPFGVILCWDQDRFGRFDPLEAGYWIHPLRKAGVRLETVGDGPIDWDDFSGRLLYMIRQEAKHQFLRDLSRNTLRGKVETAKNGGWCGLPPYAYRLDGPKKKRRLALDPVPVILSGEDRACPDEEAVPVETGNGERCGDARKSASAKRSLSPAKAGKAVVKASVVRRIYREYLSGKTVREIARRLNREGIPSPGAGTKGPGGVIRRGRWIWETVKNLLRNPAYMGDTYFNRDSRGKYYGYRGGEIVNGSRSKRTTEEDWIIVKDTHEALVSRATWAEVQWELKKRTWSLPAWETPTFAGLLRCGECGSPMWGYKIRGLRHYRCRSRDRAAGGPRIECGTGTLVQERKLVDFLGVTDPRLLGDMLADVDRIVVKMRSKGSRSGTRYELVGVDLHRLGVESIKRG